ncbi:MAG: tetratricopeptide repeat protein [Kiritimatiellaeota bacterium]|nr:tetratricopeptide repeat protein [Kiritimatiellota bacterium]
MTGIEPTGGDRDAPVPRAGRSWSGRAVKWGAAIAAVTLLGAGSWYGLAWLQAPAVRERLPRLPELRDASPLMTSAIRAADAAARHGLPSAERIGRLGLIYQANLFHSQADACYAVAAELAPRDDRWPYGRGLLAYVEGRLEQARKFFAEAADRRPDNPCAWLRLGDANLKLDRLDAAAAAYRKAAERRGYALHAQFGLARVAERRGDWAKVVERLEDMVKQVPTFGPGRRLLAAAYRELGRQEDARRVLPSYLQFPAAIAFEDPFERTLERLSFSSTFLLQQAAQASRRNLPRLEGDILFHLVQVAPNDADGHLALASWCRGAAMEARSRGLHKQAGQALEQAVAEARKAISLSPRIPRAHLILGAALAMQGETEAAVAAFRRAIQLDPRMAEAHRRLGVALAGLDRPDEAVASCRKAVELEPGSADALDALGLVLARAGKWSEAAEAWKKSISINPESPTPRYNLARALITLDRRDDARRQLDELLKLNPGFGLAQNLKRELTTSSAAGRGKKRQAPGAVTGSQRPAPAGVRRDAQAGD